MQLPFFVKRKIVKFLSRSKQKNTDPEQVEFYRNCLIELTLTSTNDWNEVWRYQVITDCGEGTRIGKGNGLANKKLAMQSAKSWVDDILRDRRESVLRHDWLFRKLKKSSRS